MMRRTLPLLVLILAAGAASAETLLTAEEFEAHVAGRTLTFEVNGQAYGIERYMADRRVLWSVFENHCAIGHWYPEGEAICFLYDTAPDDPQCWYVYLDGDRLKTVLTDDPFGQALYEARDSTEEMICPNFGS
jgi:hypothetical protein